MFRDKAALPVRRFTADDGVRIVPGGSAIRRGTFVGKGVVCMPPMYINVGAYVPKTNPRIDLAIEKQPSIESFLKQRYDSLFTRDEAFEQLRTIFS